jgi:hypothetical protein
MFCTRHGKASGPWGQCTSYSPRLSLGICASVLCPRGPSHQVGSPACFCPQFPYGVARDRSCRSLFAVFTLLRGNLSASPRLLTSHDGEMQPVSNALLLANNPRLCSDLIPSAQRSPDYTRSAETKTRHAN